MRSAPTFWLAAVFLVLGACAADPANTVAGGPPANVPPPNAAVLRVGSVDTGFLIWGHTRILILSIDGVRVTGDDKRPVILTPGRHRVLLESFRDPVLAYGCITASFEPGKTYVAQSTKPFIETTTLWIDDAATGAPTSEKLAAQTMKRPLGFTPVLNDVLFGAPPDRC
jgi:hypothetical protein